MLVELAEQIEKAVIEYNKQREFCDNLRDLIKPAFHNLSIKSTRLRELQDKFYEASRIKDFY